MAPTYVYLLNTASMPIKVLSYRGSSLLSAVLALLTSDSRFCTQHQFDIQSRHIMSGPKVTEFKQLPGSPSPSLVAVADVQQITDQASSRYILYKIG